MLRKYNSIHLSRTFKIYDSTNWMDLILRKSEENKISLRINKKQPSTHTIRLFIP